MSALLPQVTALRRKLRAEGWHQVDRTIFVKDLKRHFPDLFRSELTAIVRRPGANDVVVDRLWVKDGLYQLIQATKSVRISLRWRGLVNAGLVRSEERQQAFFSLLELGSTPAQALNNAILWSTHEAAKKEEAAGTGDGA